MKFSGIVFLLMACLSSSQAQAQTGNGAPRQLGGPPALVPRPAVADSARRSVAVSPPASRFRVGLKTGPVLRATDLAAHYPVLGHAYLLVDGERRVDLMEVDFYEDETGYYRRARPRGTFREATLRRVLPGRLSVYEPRTSLY